ncbi:hypothetical protein ASD15_12895 [Massilia sp. Root351]|uniref:hypothetical protein n=1 Tax=Massilia sp. Root351 TaxID=1736522 RepID=UPI0007096F9C|nr:hypothetical protein [Massilia sp. Root351]KQV80807.1 hypothetical protein ASD15_12895 [Massilia sp. Root351]
MNQLTLVLPFALTPPELASDLARALQVPSLEILLERNSTYRVSEEDGGNRLLPHESWLSRAFSAAAYGAPSDNAPFAPAMMRALGVAQPEGYWFAVQPVHLQLTRTHMVLGDPRSLNVNDADSRALFDLVKPYFDEVGKPLIYAAPDMWFMRADDWSELRTASPDAAVNDNLADWMPEGDAKRAFRKLQNEVQMLWHEHPVNEARQQRGLQPVNSFWLWAGAPAIPGTAAGAAGTLAVANCPAWLTLLADPALRAATAEQVLPLAGDAVVVLGELIPVGKAGDWSPWLAHMQQIEQQWFAPLLAALKAGRLGSLKLVFSSHLKLAEFTITKGSLRKFWRKPALTKLTP